VARERGKKEEIFGRAERPHAIHTGEKFRKKNGWTGRAILSGNAAGGDGGMPEFALRVAAA
jgi:hypothetical protein